MRAYVPSLVCTRLGPIMAAAVIAACAAARPPQLPLVEEPSLPALTFLTDAPPEVTCADASDRGILEGAAVDDPRWHSSWLEGCLPEDRVLGDAELLRAAEITLEPPGAGRRSLTSFTRGVLLRPAGWKRRQAQWAARIAFDQGGVQGVALVDAVHGVRLERDEGLDAAAAWPFFTVPTERWGGARDPSPREAPDMIEVERMRLERRGEDVVTGAVIYDARCAEVEGGCHLRYSQVSAFCDRAQRIGCVEPLERDFAERVVPRLRENESPFVILAQRGGDIRWLTSGEEVLAFLGGPLASSREARLFLAASGTRVPVPGPEEEQVGASYYRYDDPSRPLEPGQCSGFYLELDGRKKPLCLPKVACHPPTPQQLRESPPEDRPPQVCETGDGGFSYVVNRSGCPCAIVVRNGQLVRMSCAPCAQRRE